MFCECKWDGKMYSSCALSEGPNLKLLLTRKVSNKVAGETSFGNWWMVRVWVQRKYGISSRAARTQKILLLSLLSPDSLPILSPQLFPTHCADERFTSELAYPLPCALDFCVNFFPLFILFPNVNCNFCVRWPFSCISLWWNIRKKFQCLLYLF